MAHTVQIDVVQGDLTEQHVDAIVNAANRWLLGGGGVDGAVHEAGGPAILAACQKIRATSLPDGLDTGDAVATTAGLMPARWVIHTVGPKAWEHEDGGPALLAGCHTAALAVAEGLGAVSVAFPAISCGVYGWSARSAAPVAVAAVRAHPSSSVRLVRFVLWNDEAYQAFAEAAAG